MAHKVIVPQKNYVPQFLKQRDINSQNTAWKYIKQTVFCEIETSEYFCELLIQKPSLLVILSSQKICGTIPFTLSFVALTVCHKGLRVTSLMCEIGYFSPVNYDSVTSTIICIRIICYPERGEGGGVWQHLSDVPRSYLIFF